MWLPSFPLPEPIRSVPMTVDCVLPSFFLSSFGTEFDGHFQLNAFFFTEFTEFSFSRRFFFVPLLSFFENGPVAVDLLNFLSKILIKGKHLAE